MPSLRGVPDQPEFSRWITRTCECSAANRSSRAGVWSVDPSSTKISSSSSAGIVCASNDSMHGSM